ncbi:MAG: HEPN domain-containing protein [Tannerella sp.]|jgi:uncharacterized protein (UPF0332 family)|nr:HEPN domain-containing protein [Tannerella sp.]
MTLQPEDRKAIVTIRLQRATETMAEVKGAMQLGYWRMAANRLYYACYYAVSALLINNNVNVHSHAGVINQFGLHFVSKGLVTREHGKLFKQLFNLRQSGDYDDWFELSEADIKPFIESTEQFIKEIETLITG